MQTVETPKETARRRLLMTLGDARFVRFAEVSAGRVGKEAHEQTFELVGLYVHRLCNQFRELGGHSFLINNTFLSSHAYNIGLAFLYNISSAETQKAALRHNYKKFFSECILGAENLLIGRALLIETLAYEQHLMKLIFTSVEHDPTLRERADALAETMSAIVSQHELSHYMLRRSGSDRQEFRDAAFNGRLGETVDQISSQYASAFAEEVLCDGLSAWTLVNDASTITCATDEVSRLRMVALGFLCFSDLVSLQMSALATVEHHACEDSQIELGSHLRPKQPYSYTLGRDKSMDIRACAVVALLEEEAKRRGASLFGYVGSFPLPEDTPIRLRTAFETFMDPEVTSQVGLTGTDLERRQMAQLLAEALHEHEPGVQHLLWRSKRFTQAGASLDP